MKLRDENIRFALINLDQAFAMAFGVLKDAPDATKERLNYTEFKQAYLCVHRWLESVDEKYSVLDESGLDDDILNFYNAFLIRINER